MNPLNRTLDSALLERVIFGFRSLSGEALSYLAADLGQSATGEDLSRAQALLSGLGREPTVGELVLLLSLRKEEALSPTAATVKALSFADSRDARIWNDLLKQAGLTELLTSPPTPEDIPAVTARALARVGIRAPKALDSLPLPLAVALGRSPILAENGIALLEEAATAVPRQEQGRLLLALFPEEDVPFDVTVARFRHAFFALNPLPLALIPAQGIGAVLHLLPEGTEIDLGAAGKSPDKEGFLLTEALAGTLLVTVPATALLPVLQSGAPVKLIGKLTKGDGITLRDGIRLLASLPTELLTRWQKKHPRSLCLPHTEPTNEAPSLSCADTEEHLFLAGTAKEAPHALIGALLDEAISRGGTPRRGALTVALTMPTDGSDEILSTAASTLLALHRICAELLLPLSPLRIITATTECTPSMTVFLHMAKKKRPARQETHLKKLLVAEDFATARQTLFESTAQNG